jgi:hypothetical protein
MAIWLGPFTVGFIVGLIIGEIALLVVLAFVRIGEPSRELSSIEPEGFPDLVPSLQKQDALV